VVATEFTVGLTGVPAHWEFWKTRKFVHQLAQLGKGETVFVVDEQGRGDGYQRVKLATAAAADKLVQAIRTGVCYGKTRIGIGVGPAAGAKRVGTAESAERAARANKADAAATAARASWARAAEAAAAKRLAAASTANATGRGGGSEDGKMREAAEEAGRPGVDAEARAASDGEAAVVIEPGAAAVEEAEGGAGGGGPAAAAAAVVAGAAEWEQAGGVAAGAVVVRSAAAEQKHAAGEAKEEGGGDQEEEEGGAQQQGKAWLDGLVNALCELNKEELMSVGQEVHLPRKRGGERERGDQHAIRIAAWAAGGKIQRTQLEAALERTEAAREALRGR
jgi:hypothetical protein